MPKSFKPINHVFFITENEYDNDEVLVAFAIRDNGSGGTIVAVDTMENAYTLMLSRLKASMVQGKSHLDMKSMKVGTFFETSFPR